MGGTKRKEDTENAAPSLLHPKRLDGNGRLVASVAAALALIRTGGGNSSNEEESWQIVDERGNCDCEKLRALARLWHVRCFSSEHGILCPGGGRDVFQRRHQSAFISDADLAKAGKNPTFQPSSPTSASSSCFPDFMPNAHSTARQSRPRPRMKEATAKMQSYCERVHRRCRPLFLSSPLFPRGTLDGP